MLTTRRIADGRYPACGEGRHTCNIQQVHGTLDEYLPPRKATDSVHKEERRLSSMQHLYILSVLSCKSRNTSKMKLSDNLTENLFETHSISM